MQSGRPKYVTLQEGSYGLPQSQSLKSDWNVLRQFHVCNWRMFWNLSRGRTGSMFLQHINVELELCPLLRAFMLASSQYLRMLEVEYNFDPIVSWNFIGLWMVPGCIPGKYLRPTLSGRSARLEPIDRTVTVSKSLSASQQLQGLGDAQVIYGQQDSSCGVWNSPTHVPEARFDGWVDGSMTAIEWVKNRPAVPALAIQSPALATTALGTVPSTRPIALPWWGETSKRMRSQLALFAGPWHDDQDPGSTPLR
ncbi:hypothetical protein BDZ91DRAFT_813501 [Kalaharituber pfeilii]|nr:hypothetical protein BDZ91DRAFT_813501 [Kalaharituber pfeilii]